jgi:hypothetical protein
VGVVVEAPRPESVEGQVVSYDGEYDAKEYPYGYHGGRYPRPEEGKAAVAQVRTLADQIDALTAERDRLVQMCRDADDLLRDARCSLLDESLRRSWGARRRKLFDALAAVVGEGVVTPTPTPEAILIPCEGSGR